MSEVQPPTSPPVTGRNGTREVAYVLWLTLGLNLLVAALKIVYGKWSGLVAVYADGLHSLTDGLSNVIGLVSLYFASRPPDEDHPYGHQKIEIFAAGGVGLFLLATASTVGLEVYRKLAGVNPPSAPSGAVMAVMAGTFAVILFVAFYERRKGKKLQSQFLISDSAHTASDLLVTVGVIVSVVLGYFGFAWADPLCGTVVAVWILWAGIQIVRENAEYLADMALLDTAQVRAVCLSVNGVISCTDIRSRGSPGMVFVDLSIQVDPDMTVGRAHNVSHEVADSIRRTFTGIRDVTVHTEPAA